MACRRLERPLPGEWTFTDLLPKIRYCAGMLSLAQFQCTLLSLVLLSSCATDTRSIQLADIDFRDMRAVQDIRGGLSPKDGVAFANYVVRHRSSSSRFCGRLLTGLDGRQPETVGEAIDLAKARELEERAAAEKQSRPKHPLELAQIEWDELIAERDILIDEQTLLRAEHGPAAERSIEWTSIQTKMTEIEDRLLAIKPKLYGPGQTDGN